MTSLPSSASAGTVGPAGAIVTKLTPSPIHATAFATLTLFNNFLGLAAGPYITGILADRFDLLTAMQVATAMPILALTAFSIGRLSYRKDVDAFQLRNSGGATARVA